ncbi:helix-turn-helix domain-containing protein [Xanthomonas sacchari]|uniref:helix-turn-helix domain-containing protein n=1 Tax=Xanthomonas sacchari TaxID=56458 RepID=UPI0020C39599|nr:helix-turn-helix transcriptional regulator [Xanthomonas sacchari]
MNADSIASRIRSARKSRGLSQTQLSKLIGVNRATIGHWERNESFSPNRSHLQALSKALHVSLDWLALGLDAPVPRMPVDSRAKLEFKMVELSKHLPTSFLVIVVALMENAEMYL